MMNKKRINSALKNMDISAYLITNAAEIFYLTGVELEGFCLLFARKKAYAFCSPMLKGQLEGLLKGIKIIAGTDPVKSIADFLKKNNIKKLGINTGKTNCATYLKLKGSAKLIHSAPVSELRKIKDLSEIKAISKACKIAYKVFNLAKSRVKPGVSEKQIAFKIEEYFAKFHVKAAFPSIVAFGPNTANPHHIPSDKKARKNDIITIDLGCIYKGYCSDLTRTFFLGKIPTLEKNIYNIVEKAKKASENHTNKARQLKELDKIARDLIASKGFGSYFIHSTGHSLGIEVHENPGINKNSEDLLRQGMVFTIEPGIYIPGKFGVRIEDTGLITKKGYKILTRA